jgi:hypothetical protein
MRLSDGLSRFVSVFCQRSFGNIRGAARWCLFVVALLTLVYAIMTLQTLWRNVSYFDGRASLDTIPYTEPVKAAIGQKVDASKSLFQASLVIIAALFGLIIAKKGETKLLFSTGHIPEWGMFFISIFCMVGSFWACYQYLDMMGSIHTLGNADITFQSPSDVVIYDFRDEHLNIFLVEQMHLFIAGVVVAFFAIFSAHVLRGDEER